MFVRTEWLSERRCLVGTRRVRSPGDPSACAAQWLDVEGGGDEPQRETDRARFIGRGHDQRDPVALAGELSVTVGTVLDPKFSVRRRVRIATGEPVVLQLWTVAAGTREETLALDDRIRDAGAFASASESTLQRSQETLAGLGIDAAQAQRLQRLAGALLYSDPTLRATSGDMAKGQGGPTTLWAEIGRAHVRTP